MAKKFWKTLLNKILKIIITIGLLRGARYKKLIYKSQICPSALAAVRSVIFKNTTYNRIGKHKILGNKSNKSCIRHLWRKL